MRTVQDQFFDANYWSPTAQSAANFGISNALGTSVVYDGHMQGAWGTVRDLTSARFGALGTIGENHWLMVKKVVCRADVKGHRHGFGFQACFE